LKQLIQILLFLLIVAQGTAQRKLVVAQDGSGDFLTVQQAFDVIPSGNIDPYVVFVKKGVYKEVVGPGCKEKLCLSCR